MESLTSCSNMQDMQHAQDIDSMEDICVGQAIRSIGQQPSASDDPLQHATAQGAPEQQQTTSVPPEQPAAWQNYSSVFTAAKAGMSGVDQQKVKQVVYEMSKDSAHFANEQRKQAQTDARISRLKAQAAQLTPAQLAAYQKACDAKITLLEAGRVLDKVWLLIDMDSFYASVEERDQPSLKGKPMAVGGMGMICTANYEARKYGVRSAMPGFIAKKLCPQLVFVKPNFSKYSAASAEAFAVFRRYDERMQGASLDEAYLDVTQHCNTHGLTGEQVASEVRARVVEATRGLTCSVGVAPNMMLAKIAADRNKPNGQYVVGTTRDEVMDFIADLPIRKLPGIGKVTEQVLQALGVSTCSDLLRHAALITALMSDISSSSLITAGLGLGATEHSSRGGGPGSSEPGRKGISCERTFGAMSSAADMEQMAESLVVHLASDMASEGIEAKTLTLKLKTTAFEVRTRAVTLSTYVSTPSAMLPPILRLLRAELPVEVRLMGVRGSSLRKTPQPLDQLAAEGDRKLNALERMVLQARQQQQHQEHEQQGPEQQQERQKEDQQQEQTPLFEQRQSQGWEQEHECDQEWGWVADNEQEAREQQQGMEIEEGALDEFVSDEEGEGGDVVLTVPWQHPTQEQLQDGYGQQCRDHYHQQKQQQQHDDSSNPGASAAAAAAAGEEWMCRMAEEEPAAAGCWEGDLHHHHQQQEHAAHQQSKHAAHQPEEQLCAQGTVGSLLARQATGSEQGPFCEEMQQQLGQQPAEWPVLRAGNGRDGTGQTSKRRRHSFIHPYHQQPHPPPAAAGTAAAAAVPVGFAQTQQQQLVTGSGWLVGQHDTPQQQHHPLQQQQQPRLDAAADRQQHQQHHQQEQPSSSLWHDAAADKLHPSWQKASHLMQQQTDSPQGQHYQCNPQQQQQHISHAVGDDSAASTGGKAAAGRARCGCSSSGTQWACLACTYSGNKQQWLRCLVCETPKGDAQPPQALLVHHGRARQPDRRTAAAAAAAAAASGVAGVAGGGGRGRGRGKGIGAGGQRGRGGGHSSSSRQLTLEHLGLQKQSS